jgi:uncharacterized protein YydD (DUF2326 family)
MGLYKPVRGGVMKYQIIINNGTLKGFIAFKGSCLATMQDKYQRLKNQGHKLKLIRGE